MSWPSWHLSGEPLALVKYVLPDEVGRYLRLPGRSDAGRLDRLRRVYTAFVDAQVQYSFEPAPREPGWQVIRTPAQVLHAPRHGTCLDLAVTMAGACLVAGLHPLIVVVEAEHTPHAAHAVLLVWLGPDETGYPLAAEDGWWSVPPDGFADLVQRRLDGPPRPFVAVDPIGCTHVESGPNGWGHDVDLATAVRNGASYLTDTGWRWRVGVDVGQVWRPEHALSPDQPGSRGDRVWPGRGSVSTVGQWRFAGGKGRSHFIRHAYGRRPGALRGDLYVGRKDVLKRIVAHCTEDVEPVAPLIITGQPGSGKSTVLARAVLQFEEEGTRGVAIHALDAALTEVVEAVAAACGLMVTSDTDLVTQLSEAPVGRLIVAVDALDEMRTSRDRDEAAMLLRDLAGVVGLRVVVATRSLASTRPRDGGSWRRSDLVRLLCPGRPDLDNLVNLDANEYFAEDELIELVERVLVQGHASGPSATQRAWTRYAADPRLRRRLARKVQQRAGRNYLAAAIAASMLADDEQIVDPESPDFDEATLPDGIGEAMDKLISRLDDTERVRLRGLLVALAYGRGSGLTDQRWLRFAEALGYSALTAADVQRLRTTAAVDYLLEDLRKDGRLLTRLFHRALADHLRGSRDRVRDESILCDVLLRQADESGWDDKYIRRFLPSHVLAAGRCEEFLGMARFLVHCYPSSVGPVARAVRVRRSSEPASVFRMAMPYLREHGTDNVAALELAARMQGGLTLADGLAVLRPERAEEILCVEATPSQVPVSVFLQHAKGLRDICTITSAAGLPVVVTVSDDGTARVWDPYHPDTPEIARFTGHQGPVMGVTVMPWPNREHPVVITTSTDHTARIWDPLHPDTPEIARFTGHQGPVMGVAIMPWPNREHPVVITTSTDHTARIWDPLHPDTPEIARFTGHQDWVAGITVLSRAGAEHPVVVTTSGDSTARVWDPVPDPPAELFVYEGHRGRVRHVFTLPQHNGRPLVASSADDGTVHLWRVDGNEVDRLGVYDAHSGAVRSGTYVSPPPGEAPVIVSVCSDGTAHVWDPDHLLTDNPDDRDGHTGRVRSAVFLPRGDHPEPLLITTSNDGTARVWEITDGRAVSHGVFSGHSDWVRHVELLAWPGRPNPVVATASGDGSVRIWDPASIEEGELATVCRHDGPVRSICAARIRGISLPVLVSAGADGTVRLWNPYGLTDEDIAVLRHPGIVRRALVVPDPHGRPIVAAATDGDVYLWDLDRSHTEPVAVFSGHRDWVRDLAVLESDQGPRICSVSNDGTLRIWDPSAPSDDDHLIGRGHGDWIWGVTVSRIGGSTRIVTTSADGTVRFWRYAEGQVREVAQLQLMATGLSVRAWRDRLVVTTSRGFVVYRLAEEGEPPDGG